MRAASLCRSFYRDIVPVRAKPLVTPEIVATFEFFRLCFHVFLLTAHGGQKLTKPTTLRRIRRASAVSILPSGAGTPFTSGATSPCSISFAVG